MRTAYQPNADELNGDFIEAIKTLYRHKTIKVTIQEEDDHEGILGKRNSVEATVFSPFPNGLKLSRDDINDRKPEYQTLCVFQ